ncbi:aspartyl/asparaginyl beta-hydroxylase-like isoform X2 [Physella acuta]|uniref:aspartyl/asparaginyl beta-hydroxylase-like isoform X2 n=1 Tax=Physella acuta TaxID=109671 RepID=UPI0027DBD385|nr:aspartyl/asparaginyl beta-hydroxylase-like isoform X2 [Physella acuta]
MTKTKKAKSQDKNKDVPVKRARDDSKQNGSEKKAEEAPPKKQQAPPSSSKTKQTPSGQQQSSRSRSKQKSTPYCSYFLAILAVGICVFGVVYRDQVQDGVEHIMKNGIDINALEVQLRDLFGQSDEPTPELKVKAQSKEDKGQTQQIDRKDEILKEKEKDGKITKPTETKKEEKVAKPTETKKDEKVAKEQPTETKKDEKVAKPTETKKEEKATKEQPTETKKDEKVAKPTETKKDEKVAKPTETKKDEKVAKPTETKKDEKVAKEQPTETKKDENVAKPTETKKDEKVAKEQPTETKKDEKVAKEQPTETKKDEKVAKEQPTETKKDEKVAKPTETKKEEKATKEQPTETKKDEKIAKPTEAKKDEKVAKEQPTETKKDEKVAKPTETKKEEKATKEQPTETKKDEKVAKPTEAQKDEKVTKPTETKKDEKVATPTEAQKDEKVAKPTETKKDEKVAKEQPTETKKDEKVAKPTEAPKDEKPAQTEAADAVKPEAMKQETATDEIKEKVEDAVDIKNYKFASITNEIDFVIHKDLDEADALFNEENYEKAVEKYDEILRVHTASPRAYYGKGLTLDKLGFKYMSNDYLEHSIKYLERVLMLEKVPDDLHIMAARKLADRQQFRGWGAQAVKTYKALSQKFPKNLEIKNAFGVSHMMIGQNDRAREVFMEVLRKDPQNGFAKAHLGFIYKVDDNNLPLAIDMLKEGIDSKAPGTEDGRFYLHLGDSLQRLGQEAEARHYFKEGEKKGLFLSEWQRSLYNVKGLTSRPWWTEEQTGYKHYLKLLQDNWQVIRDEGLAQLDPKSGSFVPEEENLRDKGDWKQFTLFQQGRKNGGNCMKVPKTCELIDQIPDAKDCKRGQVKFSVMHPGIHVWPHVGPTNCRIRAHLGLVVPEGPRIRVVNETRTWKEGQFIIFDDSFEHEVWHDGKELRLVLIVDFWHPDLTDKQRKRLSAI